GNSGELESADGHADGTIGTIAAVHSVDGGDAGDPAYEIDACCRRTEGIEASREISIVAGLDGLFEYSGSVDEDAKLCSVRIEIADAVTSGVFGADRDEQHQRADR